MSYLYLEILPNTGVLTFLFIFITHLIGFFEPSDPLKAGFSYWSQKSLTLHRAILSIPTSSPCHWDHSPAVVSFPFCLPFTIVKPQFQSCNWKGRASLVRVPKIGRMRILVPQTISPKLGIFPVLGHKNEKVEQLINHDIQLFNAVYTIPSLLNKKKKKLLKLNYFVTEKLKETSKVYLCACLLFLSTN